MTIDKCVCNHYRHHKDEAPIGMRSMLERGESGPSDVLDLLVPVKREARDGRFQSEGLGTSFL